MTARDLAQALDVEQKEVVAWEAESAPDEALRRGHAEAAGPGGRGVPASPKAKPGPRSACSGSTIPSSWEIVRKLLEHPALFDQVAELSARYADPGAEKKEATEKKGDLALTPLAPSPSTRLPSEEVHAVRREIERHLLAGPRVRVAIEAIQQTARLEARRTSGAGEFGLGERAADARGPELWIAPSFELEPRASRPRRRGRAALRARAPGGSLAGPRPCLARGSERRSRSRRRRYCPGPAATRTAPRGFRRAHRARSARPRGEPRRTWRVSCRNPALFRVARPCAQR